MTANATTHFSFQAGIPALSPRVHPVTRDDGQTFLLDFDRGNFCGLNAAATEMLLLLERGDDEAVRPLGEC